MNRKNHIATIRITLTAIFMSLNIVMSSFGIPVPGGHLYFCDAVICLASILLNPFEAFIVGGIGSFIGDMIFYPASMFVSLFAHGLQAAAISLISHKTFKNSPKLASGIGVTVGSVIMVIMFTLGRIFVYSTPEYAVIKLPYEIFQAVTGAVIGMILCWKYGIGDLFSEYVK